MQGLTKLALTLAALALVGACSGGTSEPPVSLPRPAESLASAPVVTSRAAMRKYANLFRSACLLQSPSFAQTDAILTSNGLNRIAGTGETSGNRSAAYTDGVAYASLSVSSRANNVCSVAIKTLDDDPLVAELRRVVSGTRFAEGIFSEQGVLGTGYIAPQTADKGFAVILGRQRRSAQSPTSITLIDFR